MQLQDYIFYYHSDYLKKLQRNYARATRAQCTSTQQVTGLRPATAGHREGKGSSRSMSADGSELGSPAPAPPPPKRRKIEPPRRYSRFFRPGFSRAYYLIFVVIDMSSERSDLVVAHA